MDNREKLYSLKELKTIVKLLIEEGDDRREEIISEYGDMEYDVNIFLNGYNGGLIALLFVLEEMERSKLKEYEDDENDDDCDIEDF